MGGYLEYAAALHRWRTVRAFARDHYGPSAQQVTITAEEREGNDPDITAAIAVGQAVLHPSTAVFDRHGQQLAPDPATV